MALPDAQHFYFRSANGRYRAHIGTRGALVMASCQGVSRLKMDTQKLMTERKHFGLKFHLLPDSREMVELVLFTNRAEVKEVRLRIDGKEIPTVSEAMYRKTEAEAPAVEAGAATLVQPPPGMSLNDSPRSSGAGPTSPEQDDVLDRLAIMTGSGLHPAIGKVSGSVPVVGTISGSVPAVGRQSPPQGLRIEPGHHADTVPPLAENAPTPAYSLPPVVKPAGDTSSMPSRKVKPARSSLAPAAKSAVQSAPAEPAQPPQPAKPATPATPATPAANDSVKPNKNAIAPDGDLQVPDGLDDLLAAAEGDDTPPPPPKP